MKEKINISIPNYNGSLTILSTIDSVLSQTYKNWIINIYDNDSSDDSIKLISMQYTKYIAKGKIKIHLNDKFISQAKNWNRCLANISLCKYFKLLCSDDILEPNHLESAINALSKTDDHVAGFSAAINYINQKNIIIGYRSYGFYSYEFWLSLFYRNYIGCPSSIIIKSSQYQNYKYSEIPYVGDLIFNMEFYLDNKKFIFDKVPSVRFMVHENSSTTKLFGSKTMMGGRSEFRRYIIKRLDNNLFKQYIFYGIHIFILITEKIFFTARKIKILTFNKN
jgi:glycosyltransferase involved in cell wall biosynthesis